MPKIVVDLPTNSNRLGVLRLELEDGQIVGPFWVLGRADQYTAAYPSRRKDPCHRNLPRNYTREANFLYGDTPLGVYQLAGIRLTGAGTPFSATAYGPYGIILLRPLDGQAYFAAKNGRTLFAIQGGELNSVGGLRPTNGSLRLYNHDLHTLTIALEELSLTSGICCYCFETNRTFNTDMSIYDEGYDEGDPLPIPSMNNIAYGNAVVDAAKVEEKDDGDDDDYLYDERDNNYQQNYSSTSRAFYQHHIHHHHHHHHQPTVNHQPDSQANNEAGNWPTPSSTTSSHQPSPGHPLIVPPEVGALGWGDLPLSSSPLSQINIEARSHLPAAPQPQTSYYGSEDSYPANFDDGYQ